MPPRKALTSQEIKTALKTLDGWTVKDGKLHKQFRFNSFAAALGWMVSVGVIADKIDHHPEWSNVYNQVTVNLVTHDLGNVIGSWDLILAEKMNQLSQK